MGLINKPEQRWITALASRQNNVRARQNRAAQSDRHKPRADSQ